ncbi:unnamed protein product [Dibothriocephalus latus]|uniref:Receptor ligand binding region domain-containing protein n=1 Tax=Dibothriocephalus latus TaxID=60516 RepID=A0A3P7M4D4_DIBLA|nr:unnamed protein product [Dibothriocephalus latus]
MACTLNTICWMRILNFAMALTPPKLNLYLGDIDGRCWPEGKVYDIFDTLLTTIGYAAVHTYGQLEPKDISFAFAFVSGCSLTEAKHISSVISFLRNGWKNILVLFEASPSVLTYRALARKLEMYMTRVAPGQERFNVVTVHNLQLNSDPREIVERFCNSCEAIVLLARSSIFSYFIDMVSNISFCENSETAIVQVDQSNAITYDALRLWRYILSKHGALGSAGQCFFMMSILPAGQGFDISSFILESVNAYFQLNNRQNFFSR